MTTEKNSDLVGIVLMGGKSQRMGMDKSQISYHDMPQYLYLYRLLSKYCSEVYLSCNAEQLTKIESSLSLIKDVNDNAGPLEGIKSVFNTVKNSILTVPCDMPGISDDLILKLIKSRNSDFDAICFSDDEDHINPLLAIWEKSCLGKLQNFDGDSPKQFLKGAITRIIKGDSKVLRNVNTPEELRTYLSHQG